jgi:hypothetical protein
MSTVKRKVLLIDPKFQFSFIAYSVAISVLTSLVNSGMSRLQILDSAHYEFNFFSFAIDSSLLGIFITFSVNFLLIFTALILSNRIAGPLYRMRNHMLAISEKRPVPPIYFRDRDYFIPLNEAYNELLKKLDVPHIDASAKSDEDFEN